MISLSPYRSGALVALFTLVLVLAGLQWGSAAKGSSSIAMAQDVLGSTGGSEPAACAELASSVSVPERKELGRAAVDEVEAWVVVVDPEGQPVPGARVLFVGADGRRRESRTDLQGVADLAATGIYALQVEAEGFLALPVVVDVEPEATVSLVHTAEVELILEDQNGVPREGVHVALLSPREWGPGWAGALADRLEYERSDPTADTLQRLLDDATTPTERRRLLFEDGAIQRLQAAVNRISGPLPTPWRLSPDAPWPVAVTDEQGMARWEGVPALGGYRWGLLSSERCAMEPTYERKDDYGRPLAKCLSGPFDVDAQASVTVRGTLLEGSSVRGQIVGSAAGVHNARIDLRRVQPVTAPDGTQAEGWLHAAAVEPDETGLFLADNLAPGKYLLSAQWQTGPADHFFDGVIFELSEGQQLELGILDGREGMIMNVEVGFVDERGATIPAEAVLADAAAGVLELMVGSGEGVPVERDITARLEVRPDAPAFLHGLSAGGYQLQAQLPMFSRGLAPAWRLKRATTYAEVALGGLASFRVDVVVERVAELTVEFPLPDTMTQPLAEGFLVRASDGRVEALTLGTQETAQGALARGRRPIPAGHWQLVVRVWDGAEALNQAYFADESFEFSVPEGRVLSPALRPGATLRGRALDAQGNPRAGALVSATPSAFAGPNLEGAWMAKVRTDATGAFTLPGLPPNTQCVLRPGAELVRTGEPGSVGDVDLWP